MAHGHYPMRINERMNVALKEVAWSKRGKVISVAWLSRDVTKGSDLADDRGRSDWRFEASVSWSLEARFQSQHLGTYFT